MIQEANPEKDINLRKYFLKKGKYDTKIEIGMATRSNSAPFDLPPHLNG